MPLFYPRFAYSYNRRTSDSLPEEEVPVLVDGDEACWSPFTRYDGVLVVALSLQCHLLFARGCIQHVDTPINRATGNVSTIRAAAYSAPVRGRPKSWSSERLPYLIHTQIDQMNGVISSAGQKFIAGWHEGNRCDFLCVCFDIRGLRVLLDVPYANGAVEMS